MASTPPPPPSAAAIQSRLAHLRRYSNLSYITTHQSITSNDPTVRLPRQELSAQESHEQAVLRESEVLRERIREEQELLSRLPPPPSQPTPHQTPRQQAQSHLNDLLTTHHLHTQKLTTSLPPPIYSFPAPSPTSPLNPLLLHHQLSTSLNTLLTSTLPATRNEISHIKKEILTEESSLKNSLALTTSLQTRIAELEKQLHLNNSQNADPNETEPATTSKDLQIHESLTQSLEFSLVKYTSSQRLFLKELSKFINTHLSPLLAAESLGGPVVGEDLLVQVDKDVIGFDKSGKPKRGARSDGQRTIHDMFSSRGSGTSRKEKKRGRNHDSGNDTDEDHDDNEEPHPPQHQQPQTKAAKDLKLLLENLMNATLQPGNQYITLPLPHPPTSASGTGIIEVDSAAVRFLVRSNVAVFHPKDARKIRLVEFWSSVED